jgi:IS30 family transposase
MKTRRNFEAAEADRLWTMWRDGQTLTAIAKATGRKPGTIHTYLSSHGGISPRPSRRPRAALAMSEREAISRGIAAGLSSRAIARSLQRAASTITREIARHGGRGIYRALYLSKRSGVSTDSKSKLRTRRKMRRARTKSNKGQTRGQIVAAVPIQERPREVDSRLAVGDWEGDLIAGKSNSWAATLVDRCTRFTCILALDGKDATTVCAALRRWLRTLPEGARRSLTWDRGTELAAHAALTAATKVPVYFCDPTSPWQRGTNENTNGLIRQYLPKGTRLDLVTQHQMSLIAGKLNARPRKVLGYKCPGDAYNEVLR